MCHSFGDITTSGYLVAILDFRHEVASAMTAGHLHVSYVVIDPCIVFETTCVSVKPASEVITTSGNLAAIFDFQHTSTSNEIEKKKKISHRPRSVVWELIPFEAL